MRSFQRQLIKVSKSGRNLSFSRISLIWTRVVLPVPTETLTSSSSLSPKFRPSALHTAGSQTHAKPPFPDRWKYDPCISSRDPSPPQPAPPLQCRSPSRLEESPGRLIRWCLPNLQPPATLCLHVSIFMFNLFLLNFK